MNIVLLYMVVIRSYLKSSETRNVRFRPIFEHVDIKLNKMLDVLRGDYTTCSFDVQKTDLKSLRYVTIGVNLAK